jgi:hypothetical protein
MNDGAQQARFTVSTVVENLRGYRNVPIDFFVTKRPGETVEPLTGDYAVDFPAEAFRELFTEDEAEALVGWLRTHRSDNSAVVQPVKLPLPANIGPTGAIAVGGPPDFLMIDESPDYDLAFKAWGYFSVEGCVFDEAASGARRMTEGIRVTNGVLQPWPYDENDKAI